MELLIVAPSGVSIAESLDAVPDDAFVWCDCVYEDRSIWAAPVRQFTGIGVLDDHMRDAENPNHPSYFDSTNDYEMIVFRGLAIRVESLDPAEPIQVKTRPIVFFLFPRVLVTIRAPDSRTVATTRTRLMSAATRSRLPSQPEELMLRILNGIVDRYMELRHPLAEQFERLQRHLLDPRRPFHDWYALLEARREARRLEELCDEQIDALQEWRDERLENADAAHGAADRGPDGLSDVLLVRTSDLVSHVDRVRGHAHRLESSLENAVQLHFSATAHRTNEIVRVLTAITAVFMPLTLITGIYGMNFDVLPGQHAPTAFWWTIGAMATIGVLMLVYFRTRAVLSTSSMFDSGLRRRRRARRARRGDASTRQADRIRSGPDSA